MIHTAAELLQLPSAEVEGIGPNHIAIGSGVRASLPDVVAATGAKRVALLVDGTETFAPDGNLKDWAAQVLQQVAEVIKVELPASTSADELAVQRATDGCAAADVVVSVGSGTISDIGKVAAGERPHVIVQTAASVNGYADDESVLLKAGVKRTAISHYAHALLIDTDVLVLAPKRLNRSGLGDTISMFTAVPDWYLSCRLGFNPRWSQAASWVHLRHAEQTLAAAPGIEAADPAALEFMAKMLTISGLSMGLAGQTSPSSGMEHTVSHMLDMWAGAKGLPHELHGAQVGVTTLWASLLWKRIRQHLDAGTLPAVTIPEAGRMEAEVLGVFAQADPSGRSGAECWSDYAAKLARCNEVAMAGKAAAFAADWPTHREFLDKCLVDPAKIAAALRAAGALVKSTDLTTPETALWALTNNHLMRNRFNVCDLAFMCGLWNPDVAADLIAEADALG